MNLQDTVQWLDAGGPGSGCAGSNCGRPSNKDRFDPKQTSLYGPKHTEELQQQKKELSERAKRAKASHVPSTQDKQQSAEKEEARVAKALGGKQLAQGKGGFDVVVPFLKVALEVKTLFPGAANDKITVHKEDHLRKLETAVREGIRPFSVAIDRRGGQRVYYYKQGVGSYRLGSMTRLKNLAELRSRIYDDLNKKLFAGANAQWLVSF